MSDELVERVAEAIYAGMFGPHTRWEDDTARQHDRMRKLARAALAIIEPAVRDECAKVALYYPTPVDAGPHEAHGRDSSAVGIAAAIRAGAKP